MGSRDTGNATSIVTALVGSMALSFGVIVGGSTLATTVVKTVVKHKRVRVTAPLAKASAHLCLPQRAAARPCTECEGKRHVPCVTCAGAAARPCCC